MLLKELDELHAQLVAENRLTSAPKGYAEKPVRFLVSLDSAGDLLSIDDAGKEKTRRLVPDIGRSSTNAPAFLVSDTCKYVLAVPESTAKSELSKAERCWGRYVDQLQQCAGEVESVDPRAAMALRAIAAWSSDPDRCRDEFQSRIGVTFEPTRTGAITASKARIAFRVDGVDPTEFPSVREWWASKFTEKLTGDREGVCQVSGTMTTLAKIMQKVKIPGNEAVLISANSPAYERYNAKRSYGAQLGVAAAESTHTALNYLLSRDENHTKVGDITYIWWLSGDIDFDPFNSIANSNSPRPEEVKAVFSRPWSGREGRSPSDRFRILGVTVNESRIIIRLNHTGTLDQLNHNTSRWVGLIEQQRADGSRWVPPVSRLAEAIVAPKLGGGKEGDAQKAKRERIVQSLLTAAITGDPLPRSLFAAVVDRIRAVPVPKNKSGTNIDHTTVACRLALLNAYYNNKEEHMDGNESAAALCGRLLAQLENAQRRALGKVNRTVTERFYAAASTQPRSVFPGLMKNFNAHLSAVGRGPGGAGAKFGIARDVAALSERIIAAGGFPTTTGIDGQAEFALAYWSERNHIFAAIEKKKNAAATDSVSADYSDTEYTEETHTENLEENA
jgi:CRISPR-associated protein Csd1